LIVLCKCVAHCRQHCQTESQTRHGLEITNCEQRNWHSRPLDRPTLRLSARRLAALESTIIVSTPMPILQDSQPLLHRNFVSVLTAQSAIPYVEPAAFASAVSPARIRQIQRKRPLILARQVADTWLLGPADSQANPLLHNRTSWTVTASARSRRFASPEPSQNNRPARRRGEKYHVGKW
jgi:hypothetical protein